MHPFRKPHEGRNPNINRDRQKNIQTHQTPGFDRRLLVPQSIAQPINKEGKK
jgi:hypothetical protein